MSTSALSDATIDTLIRDFLDPALSVSDIAAKLRIPIRKLVRLYESEAIQVPLNQVLAAIQHRSQLLAAAGIQAIVKSQRLAIDELNALCEADPLVQEHLDEPETLKTRARLREQARKSANLLLRIAKPASKSAPASAAVPATTPSDTNGTTSASPPAPSSTSTPTPSPAPAPPLPQTVPRAA